MRSSRLLGGLLLLALVMGPVSAQDAPVAAGPLQIGPANDSPQPWAINCSNEAGRDTIVCTMTQALVARDSNQRIIAATIYRPSPDAAALLRINLPHGILLQQGVDVSIDAGAPTRVPITIADQNGSYATLELTADLLVALQGGGLVTFGVKAANGEAVGFQLSLKGFTSAFAKL